MSLIKSKMNSVKRISELEKNVNLLSDENQSKKERIEFLEHESKRLCEENKQLKEKYINTGIECFYCATVLQKDYRVCPNCGKEVKHESYIKKIREEHAEQNLFQFENDRDFILITGYNGFHDKRVVIPSSLSGRTVIGIWNEVFKECESLEEVVIEEGCQYIGKSVFENCKNLKNVRFPKSLKEVGDSAFAHCSSLQEVVLPNTVMVLGANAFCQCAALNHIVLPTNLECISYGLLNGTSITSIDIPESVKHIEEWAFSDTKLREVEFPRNLYSAGMYMFDKCEELEKVVIHSNVQIIEPDFLVTERNKYVQSKGPIIYCARGSKAQLYARKNHMECVEIEPAPVVEVQPGVRGEVVGVRIWGHPSYGGDIWHKAAGISKAETWSWYRDSVSEIQIKKYMSKETAAELRGKMRRAIAQMYPGYMSEANSKYIIIDDIDCWGKSDV